MYRSIVLATDGSSLSKKAMKAALRLARDFEATLHVVTVQPPYTIPFAGEVAIPAMYDRKEYESAAKEAALKVLDEVAEDFRNDSRFLSAIRESHPTARIHQSPATG